MFKSFCEAGFRSIIKFSFPWGSCIRYYLRRLTSKDLWSNLFLLLTMYFGEHPIGPSLGISSCGVTAKTLLGPHFPMPHQRILGHTRLLSAHLVIYMRSLGLLVISHRLNTSYCEQKYRKTIFWICIKCTNVKSEADNCEKCE